MKNNNNSKKCGFIAIIGRPNVGKSTLLNKLIGKRISITTRKPQTTRNNIRGIKTVDNTQFVYVDTPGIHEKSPKQINKFLNKEAINAIYDVDIIVFVVAGTKWLENDELALKNIKKAKPNIPVILVINKIDLVNTKDELLPEIEKLKEKHDFNDIIPISALRDKNIEKFETCVEKYLPDTDFFYFDEDQSTDQSQKFITAEIIRQKLIMALGGELPYDLAVQIDKFKMRKTTKKEDILDIDAIIWVPNRNHKKIIVGSDGEKLRDIGMRSRKELEKEFGVKIFLQTWVKVKSGWYDDKRALKSLGYDNG